MSGVPDPPERFDAATGTGESEMIALIRDRDCTETPLGDHTQWSASLRRMLRFVRANRLTLLL